MSDGDSAARCASPRALKWGSLVTVVLQNAALLLVAHASRASPGGTPYFGSVAVLLTELLKAAVSLLFAVAEQGAGPLLRELRHQLLRDPYWTAAFALPALSYNVHNNLWYVAVANLDPVTIAVTTQLKIVFAAGFSRLLLGHRLIARRVAAICLLVLGLSLLQGHAPGGWRGRAAGAAGARSRAAAGEPDELRGLLAMVGVCALSGFAGALTERLLKDESRRTSLWVRNVQMAAFSTPMAAATALLADGRAIAARGPWAGFNGWLAATIALGALGGIAVSFVFRFADNILKSFAVGCSIALNCLLSWAAFGIVFPPGAGVGILLVALASAAYSLPERADAAAAAKPAEREQLLAAEVELGKAGGGIERAAAREPG